MYSCEKEEEINEFEKCSESTEKEEILSNTDPQNDKGNSLMQNFNKCGAGQSSQEENAEEFSFDSAVKHNDKVHCVNGDAKQSSINSCPIKHCNEQSFTHNNNIVIEKSNFKCPEESSCSYYMKFPFKVNNNIYPDKPIAVKDGMDDYFQQFSSSSSIKPLVNDSVSGVSSPSLPCSDCYESDHCNDEEHHRTISYPEQINALNGEEVDEDEGCIYTYKGGNYETNFSHLLQTCFSCGLPTIGAEKSQNGALSIQRILNGSSQSNPNPQSNLYSPEMDFLEMDFDPGSNGDGGESDSEDNNIGTNNELASDGDNSLESFSQLNVKKLTKTNNIPNDIRSLMCRRCELSIFNDQKVDNTLCISPKQNTNFTFKSNLHSNLDDEKSMSSSRFSDSASDPKNFNVKIGTIYDPNIPSTSHLPNGISARKNSKGRDGIENNLNFSEEYSNGESSDDDDADDEGEETSPEFPPPSVSYETSSNGSVFNPLRPQQNSLDKQFDKFCSSPKTNRQIRFLPSNDISNPVNRPNSVKAYLENQPSDHLIELMRRTVKCNIGSNSENNNLGSVSAPEVSPSKEYTPIEKFSRSVSFHNQLSSPKYENVCFSHSYKDNVLSCINKYNSSGCPSHDNNSCHRVNSSCKSNVNSETSNLEACADRLSQREKSVFNITSTSSDSLSQMPHSSSSCANCCNTDYISSCDQHIPTAASDDTKNSLGPLPLKVLQPKMADPFRDPNTVSEVDMDEELHNGMGNSQIEKVMIWTEHQATFRQVSQVGTSACGPTAVINVLLALGHSKPVKEVTYSIRTRLRAEGSSLVPYLLSRSNAGTTHEDLIRGIEAVSDGDVKGRFFHMFPKRAFQLSRWLAGWIKKGAVPVATLNLQVGVSPGQTVPDAWHHQMVFGVGPQGIYLTNPLECVSDSLLADQLCSDSVLLVRRSDVALRWDQNDKLIQLSLQLDPRWNDMNVLGQVVCVLKEEAAPEMLQGRRHMTSHVAIPASYQSGVAIFVRSDNSSCLNELMEVPDLPLLD